MKARQQGFAAFVLTAAAAGAMAQTPPPAEPEKLKEVSVVSTRTERDLNEVPNTVTVINSDDIQKGQGQVQDIGDLIRYEPNISVRSESQRRFGNGSFNIRGIDGNRVLIHVDGVRIGDEFSYGSSLLNGVGRDTVDLDTLKRVEILRGPGSAIYGSDALGGVVPYTTKDPSDYMKQADKDVYFGVHSGYASADRSFTNGFTFATGREAVQGCLHYSRRIGHETSNRGDIDVQGPTRTATNPQNYLQESLLGKIVFKPAAGQQFKLTLEDRSTRADTNVLSGVTGLPRVTDLQGYDKAQRSRISLEHEWLQPASWVNALRWNAYGQQTNN